MLQLKNVIKDYVTPSTTVHALRGVNLRFRKNEFVSILGASGCGKTLTMRSIAGPGVEFIDPAPAVAKHLEEVLEKNGKCTRNTTPGTVELLASGDDTALRRTFQLIY